MGLKLIAILFLVVGAIYAAPAVEDELEDTPDEELSDPAELDEESLDALTEEDDDEEEDQDEDAIDDEEDPKKKPKKRRTCPAVLKGKKGYRPLIGYGQYCVCRAPPRSKKGDEPEISEDDVADQVESLAEDPKRKKLSKKQKAKLFHNLIKGFFRRSDKCCYCTYNKKMVRLLAFLHKAHIMALKGRYMFYLHFRRLVYAAVGRKRASAYFKALRRG